jgi:hypothetical protein
MKNIYTLFYSLNNAEKEENYLMELSEMQENEKLIKDILSKVDFSPKQGIVEQILKFARQG